MLAVVVWLGDVPLLLTGSAHYGPRLALGFADNDAEPGRGALPPCRIAGRVAGDELRGTYQCLDSHRCNTIV